MLLFNPVRNFVLKSSLLLNFLFQSEGIEAPYCTNSTSNGKLKKRFQINIELDAVAFTLFIAAILTRLYKLDEPRNIV